MELPLQVQRPTLGEHGQAIVTLLTPAGALFDGDAVQLDAEVRAGASVQLRQASATQLRPCQDSDGILVEMRVHVAAGARFSYRPLELIPFAGSIYCQRVHLALDDGAEAELTEVVGPGRLWERFAFRRLDLATEVLLDGQLILLDTQKIAPAEMDLSLLVGGYSHWGTLLRFGPHVGAAEADALHQQIVDRGVCGSASTLPRYGIGARALAYSADDLHRAFARGLRRG